MFFAVLVAADAPMTDEEAETTTTQYISTHGFATERQIVDMLQRLLKDYDQKWVAKALHLCVVIIGSHPRTGCQAPPVEDPTKGADKAVVWKLVGLAWPSG
eukprot:4997538-Pyramimonas_sp.AAC.1